MPARHRARLCFLFVLFLVFAVPGWGLQAAERQVLPGHLSPVVRHAVVFNEFGNARQLRLALGLPLRHREALTKLLRELYDPASPRYRQFLTPEQFTQRFGPTEADYAAVLAFARTNHLTVINTYPNRLVLDVSGTVGAIEQVFQVKLNSLWHPADRRIFYAPEQEPSVDPAVPLVHIGGLDNLAYARPRFQLRPLRMGTAPGLAHGSGPGGTYLGRDFRAAYVRDCSLSGAGQRLGLVEFDGYSRSDIAAYSAKAHLPPVPLTDVLLGNATGQPSGSGGEIQVALDIELASAMAPGLSEVLVYMAPSTSLFEDLLNRIATDNLARQLSCSWYLAGSGPNPTVDEILQEMAAQGQSFFNASGDGGAYAGWTDFPCDCPYMTQVGGTLLSTAGPGGPWVAEYVWNLGEGVGSGGGISTNYALPDWQRDLDLSANQGSAAYRNTPDVAMVADQVYVRANGMDLNVGGTGCAAPLWAGFMALVNQQAAKSGRPPLGFLNPALYALGKGRGGRPVFHDITRGENTNAASPHRFCAVPGYDLCTGWGSPAGHALIDALAAPEPLQLLPEAGFSALGTLGGPFHPSAGSYLLTNVGPASLRWSLVNRSSWLAAEPTGGELSPGGPATLVSVRLKSEARALPLGTASATLWLTNLNDGVGQSLQFDCAVLQAPVITRPPTDAAVLGGAAATFSVAALGSSPLSYHWRAHGTNLADSASLSGSATPELSLSHVALADLGGYSVVISNPVGVVTSTVAPLRLLPSAPVVVRQPAEQTVKVGTTAAFALKLRGSPPFEYQWRWNGTNLEGATDSALRLTNVQFEQAGTYSVLVSNAYGVVVSSNAVLTVTLLPPCVPPPPGLVSWWQAENDPTDCVGGTRGTLVGAAHYGPGHVGRGFVLDGNGSYVNLGNLPNLQLQNFTIEAWVKRAHSTVATGGDADGGNLFGYGWDGYNFGMYNDGRLSLTKVGMSEIRTPRLVVDTRWHHLAVTKSGSAVIFYVDGVGTPVSAYDPGFTFGTTPVIGGLGTAMGHTFWGTLDEVSVYERPLAAAEIHALYAAGVSGKCVMPVPPSIPVPPRSQTAQAGKTAFFSVIAAGTPPLSYLWYFNGSALADATRSVLEFPNVQAAQAGTYSVLVSNACGSLMSAEAVLQVTPAQTRTPP